MHAVTSARSEEERARWSPRRLYTRFGIAEAVTWTLLLLGMGLKYSGISRAFVPVFGLLHGVTFLGYGAATLFVWVNQRWTFPTGVVALLSAIVPYATLPFERWLLRSGLLEGRWRLVPGGETPQSTAERLEAWCLRHPALAVVTVVVGIAALTGVLLYLGPPRVSR